MNDTYLTRIPKLTDAELLQYVQDCSKFSLEAVEIAVLELRKRGHSLTDDQLRVIQESRSQQNTWQNSRDFFHNETFYGLRSEHLQFIAIIVLIVGLGGSIVIYLNAEPASLNPLGYDPLTTKKYLREMELYGGTLNVLATQIRQWFGGLWHGRALAYTVAVLAAALASFFWFCSTGRGTRRLKRKQNISQEHSGQIPKNSR